MLWVRLFLPFAGAYFLSYLYRTANAVIGPVLSKDLALGAGSLGLLTSAYFLAFAAAQLPLGMLLDRFGARRVESGLLLIAAAGAVVFALGQKRHGTGDRARSDWTRRCGVPDGRLQGIFPVVSA
jgi:sugar phosphate permease